MRRVTYILVGLCTAVMAVAQDLQRISERNIQGTARYIGLSGAMTSMGGDPSAVKDNPAGLGVYRRMEMTATLDEQLDYTQQANANVVMNVNRFNASQASWVISFIDNQRTKGVIAHNVMLSYDRLMTFNRDYHASAVGQPSLAQVIANKTNGLYPTSLQPESRWENPDVAWLSCLGYDTYLIDPVENDSSHWKPAAGAQNVNNLLKVSEWGEMNQYSLAYAMNVSNRLYLGLGLNIQSLSYAASSKYTESFGTTDKLNETSAISLSGTGFNANIGFIYHPVEMLRLGASFQSPSVMTYTVRSDGSLATTIGGINYPETDVAMSPYPYSSTQSSFVLPLRSSVGLALQFWQYGMLSFQYDYAHWNKDADMDCARRASMSDVHTLKVGAEGVISDRIFLEAGYAYESTFAKEEPISQLEYNSVRLDTYFRNTRSKQYASFGIGYRGGWFLAHLAYQYRWQTLSLYAHELANPSDIHTDTHRIVLTLNWHMRD